MGKCNFAVNQLLERKIIFAEETQDRVHYGMPVRLMLYTALEYMKQMVKLEKLQKEKSRGLSGAEFLSGIDKEERILPVVNLVFYLGEAWDGSESLYDMLDIDWSKPEAMELRKYIPDFRINLIKARGIERPENYRTCLQHIFSMLKYNGDKKKLYEYVKAHREEINQMDRVEQTATLVLLGEQKRLLRLLEESENNEENMDMCKAIDDLIKDGEACGERRFAALTKVLLDEGRIDELQRATADEEYRQRLYAEYQI